MVKTLLIKNLLKENSKNTSIVDEKTDKTTSSWSQNTTNSWTISENLTQEEIDYIETSVWQNKGGDN